MSIKIAFMLAAFILFVLAALGVTHSRVNLMAAGLALWVLALIIP